jgi:hypothetical protein
VIKLSASTIATGISVDVVAIELIQIDIHCPAAAGATRGFGSVIAYVRSDHGVAPKHYSSAAEAIRYRPFDSGVQANDGVVFEKQKFRRPPVCRCSPTPVTPCPSVPARTIRVNPFVHPVTEQDLVMIDDADNRVYDGVAIQIVPFAIVPPKLAAVGVASVNPNDAIWCTLNLHSAAIMKLYPCDSREISCDKTDAE